MKFFHNKFSKTFFIIYFILAIVFFLQDITANKSFFDFSGLGIYLLSYPIIFLIRIFGNFNFDSKIVLYTIFIISTIIYYLAFDTIPRLIKKSDNK